MASLQAWQSPYRNGPRAFISFAIAGVAMAVVVLTEQLTGNYFPSILIVALIFISFYSWPALALFLGLLMSLAADYFYIPPIGSVLNSKDGVEHLFILMVISAFTSVLVGRLRRVEFDRIRVQASAEGVERATALVSHDLRNPLSAIKLRVAMLRRQSHNPEKISEICDQVTDISDRMDRMIQTLLDVGRKNGELPLVPSDLRAIVSEACFVFPQLDGRLIVEQPEEEIAGNWNADSLCRALENMISNAQKYGDERAPIKVSLRRSGGQAEISVHNEGKAIPTNLQREIFAPYKRGDDLGSVKGWGLGLALVKRVADAHKGTMAVRSSANQGTTFLMRLPI